MFPSDRWAGVARGRYGSAVPLPAEPDQPDLPAADLEIAVRLLDPDLPLPSYAHPGDAGADLVTTVDVTLKPGERMLVPTGIAIALPDGYVALVHPRSGSPPGTGCRSSTPRARSTRATAGRSRCC